MAPFIDLALSSWYGIVYHLAYPPGQVQKDAFGRIGMTVAGRFDPHGDTSCGGAPIGRFGTEDTQRAAHFAARGGHLPSEKQPRQNGTDGAIRGLRPSGLGQRLRSYHGGLSCERSGDGRPWAAPLHRAIDAAKNIILHPLLELVDAGRQRCVSAMRYAF